MNLAVWLLRRFIAPVVIGGVIANAAVAAQLGYAEGATDPMSIGTMVLIVLAGIVVGGLPGYLLIRRFGLSGWRFAVALLALGVVVGAIEVWLIASAIVPDNAFDHMTYGLIVGPVAAAFWLSFNLDVLRPQQGATLG